MDKIRTDALINAGIDVNDALGRFMGNEALLEMFLKKFLADKNFDGLTQAAKEKDTEKMITTSHTLKGVCGNLSMTVLFDLLNTQLGHLRSGNVDEAINLMPEISTAYYKIKKSI